MKTTMTLIGIAALSLCSCTTPQGSIVPGTAKQQTPYGAIVLFPATPVDIGRDAKPLSILTIPNLQKQPEEVVVTPAK